MVVELDIAGASPRRTEVDFLILATGFHLALSSLPELKDFHDKVLTWGDMFEPRPHQENADLSGGAWLGRGFELVPNSADEGSVASRIHVFNHAAFLSMGGLASEIPAVGAGAERLSAAIAESLAIEDVEHLRAVLNAHHRQDLEGTPFHTIHAPNP